MEQKYAFEFSQSEVIQLQQALGELPLKASLQLFARLQQTIQETDAKTAPSLPGLVAVQ